MNHRGKSLIAGVLACLLILAYPSMGRGKIIDGVFMNINGKAVTFSEFREFVAHKLQISIGDADDFLRKETSRNKLKALTDTFINVMLIRLKLKKMGETVTEQELDSVIGNIMSENKLTKDEFRVALKKEGLDFESYRGNLQEEIEKSRIIQVMKRREVLVTDGEAKDYYVENRDRFATQYNVNVEILSFPLPGVGNKEEIIRYRQLIRGGDRLLDQGGDAGELKAYFEDNGVNVVTTKTGLMPVDDMSGDIKKEVSRLGTGSISRSIFVENRIVYVKVLERKGGTIVPFKDVKDSIREELVSRRSLVAIKEIVKELRGSSYIEVHL